MTLENATQNLWKAHCNFYDPRKAINIVVDKIYSDHEAQLKAKESYLERQDMIIKCLNIDLDNKEKLLKAKDEEIKELGEIVQQYLIPSKNYDAIIKAKDEEIERLKAELLICKKRYTQKAVEGKELKKTLSIAWSKQLKEQQ